MIAARRAAILLTVLATSLAGWSVGASAEPPQASVADSAGTTELTSGWAVQSSAVAVGTGAQVSDPAYPTAGWLRISRPETLMAALVENGRYPDIFFSNRLAAVADE